MCDKSTDKYFSSIFTCNNNINSKRIAPYKNKIKTDLPNNTVIIYWAANSPDYNGSFTGSGLPFQNPEIAFENTPNQGNSIVKDQHFEIVIEFPNSFYAHLGTELIGPTLFYRSCGDNNHIHKVDLKNQIPYRLLNYPKYKHKIRDSPLFYLNKQECTVHNQETILRNSQYPLKNEINDNFWGKIIPN